MRKYFPYILLIVLLGAITYHEYQIRRVPPTLEPEPARAGVSYLLAEPIVEEEASYLVDRFELVSGGTNRDSIPALMNPDYESVYAADTHLSDEGEGIFVEVSGQPYFYPFVIMSWHEIVNDTLAGKPLSISYCPMCRSSVVYERTFEDQILDFGTTGLLLNNNLVMYDRQSESLWPQLLGTAVAGDMIGQELVQYPAHHMTFGEFKDQYSYGLVLSRNTGYERDYTQDTYWQYHETDEIKFIVSNFDGRLMAKQLIYGVHNGTESAIAYESETENSIPSYWFCWANAYRGTELESDL